MVTPHPTGPSPSAASPDFKAITTPEGTFWQAGDALGFTAPPVCPHCDLGFAKPVQPADPDNPTPRTRDTDSMRPPSVPTLVDCLHCGKTYSSALMHWEPAPEGGSPPTPFVAHCNRCGYTPRPTHPQDEYGHWMCGTPHCSGAGFCFDIHPIDEDFIDPDGRDMGTWIDIDDSEFDDDDA